MSLAAALPLSVLVLLGAVGSWLDVSQRRLPNWLCLLALIAGLAFSFLSAGWVGAGMAAGHAVIALLLGMLLFAGGIIGGGDAKFYAGLAAWLPITQGLFLVVSVALSGLVLTVMMLLPLRRRARANIGGLRPQTPDIFGQVPYGMAIAIGAVVSYLSVTSLN